MSAIKRFFSSYKTSAQSKAHVNVQSTESQSSVTKSSINVPALVDKVIVPLEIIDHDDIKENVVSPSYPYHDIPLKYVR
jgi:hypothetical protein